MQLALGILDVGTFPLSVELAPRVEALGYGRYWISEHHGEGAISNPTLLIPIIAGLTERMRVGTAGVLLRFQSALAVAENFRMLQHAFAGRIDCGLGRSPAATPAQTVALSDGRPESYTNDAHAHKVTEVQRILCGRLPDNHPLAGETIDPPLTALGAPPVWVLSTSLRGAELAARLGCHYSFHDHYSPEEGAAAVQRYRDAFVPSPELAEPTWNVCLAGYCAEDEADVADARETLFRGSPEGRRVLVGTIDAWRGWLRALAAEYPFGEVVIQTLWGSYEIERQVGSFERIAEAARGI